MINADEYSIGIKQILFITTTHKQSYETGGKKPVCKASGITTSKDREHATHRRQQNTRERNKGN